MHLKDLGYALRPLGSAHSGPAPSSHVSQPAYARGVSQPAYARGISQPSSRVSQPAYAWDVSQPSSRISAVSLCLDVSQSSSRVSQPSSRVPQPAYAQGVSQPSSCVSAASLCLGRLSTLLTRLSSQLMPGASLTQGICFTATMSLLSSTVRPLGGEVRYSCAVHTPHLSTLPGQ